MRKFFIKFKDFFKNYWQEITVFLLAVCFFAVIGLFINEIRNEEFAKWGSPDETANYIFSKLYGQSKNLIIFEKYNLSASDLVHPRSFRSDMGEMKPVSFLGIILIYGSIASVFGYKVLPYLTPFFASIGIFFYFLLIKKLFSKNIAFLSAFLLASFPVWIYYSVRSMFHNVLFISLLIIGFYFLVSSISNKKEKFDFLSLKFLKMNWLGFLSSAFAGGFIGLAIITRTSELLWLLPALLVVWIFNFWRFGILKLLIFLSCLFLAITPTLYWNQILYGNFKNSGYPQMNESVASIVVNGGDLAKTAILGKFSRISQLIKDTNDKIFYFGFDFKQSEKMFFYYFIEMFPWIFFPSFLGLFLFFQRIKKWKKRHWVFLIAGGILSTILIFYYGSWEFYDNPEKGSHTIGNSYTRYWLPIYLLAIPFACLFFIKFSKSLFSKNIDGKEVEVTMFEGKKEKFFRFDLPGRNFWASAIQAIIISIIFFISFNFVYLGSKEGLMKLFSERQSFEDQCGKVLSLTENNSVIITQYHDKLFFPERKVVVGLLTDDKMNLIYANLAKLLPVYYYNFTFNEKDLVYLNEKKLKDSGLSIEFIQKINSDFSLYRIKITEILKK